MLIIKFSAPGNVKATRNCGDGGQDRNVHADTHLLRKHSVSMHFTESRFKPKWQLKKPRATTNRNPNRRITTANRDVPNGWKVRPARRPPVNLALTPATGTTLL
jgi:hypothetical protein